MATSYTQQCGYRGRTGDTVSLNDNTTWAALENTGWVQQVDVTFRVRIQAEETNNKNEVLSGAIEYSLNGGAWTAITTTSNAVKAVASGQFNEDDTTTKVLTSSTKTFAGGYGVEDGVGTGVALQNTCGEWEFSLQLDSTYVANGNTVEIRLISADGWVAGRTVTITASALTTVPGSITGDAVVFKTTEQSVTADAVVFKTTEQSVTADAVVFKTTEQSVTADAWIHVPLALNIDHETGDNSQYTGETDADGDFNVTSGAAIVGGYGAELTIDDTNQAYGYFEPDAPNYTGTLRIRYYLDSNSFPASLTTNINSLRLYNSTPLPIGYTTWRAYSGGHDVRITIIDDAGTNNSGTYHGITDEPHFIEILLVRATSDVAGDGYMSLWIDGVFKQTISSIDNFDRFNNFDRLEFGVAAISSFGESGTLYLDDLVANDTGAVIGGTLEGSINGDAVIQVLDNEQFVTGDAVIQVLDNEQSVTGDAVIQVLDNEQSVTGDAVIQVLDNEQSVTGDAVIQNEQGPYPLTADARILVVVGQSVTGDAVIQKEQGPHTFTGDARIIVSGTVFDSITGDAVVQVLDNEQFVTGDAVIQKELGPFTFTGDARIAVVIGQSITGYAVIFKTTEQGVTADAIVLATLQDSLLADAVVLRTEPGSIAGDAVVLRTEPGSIAGDAVVFKTTEQFVTGDAWILGVSTVSDSITADAVIFTIVQDSLLADAVIFKTTEPTFTADAYIATVSVVPGSVTADAVVFKTTGQSVAADAVILKTESDTFAADSVLLREIQDSILAAAIVLKTEESGVTGDAVILSALAQSITGDAVIFRPGIASALSADAVFLREFGFTFTADARITDWIEPEETGIQDIVGIVRAKADSVGIVRTASNIIGIVREQQLEVEL